MEVWIRSQDKEWFQQVKCVCYTSTISYLEFDDDEEMVGQVIHKRGHGIRCDGIFFREYPTKERCLEIIDEIQSLFCDFLICKDVSPCDHPQFKKLGLTSIHYVGKEFEPKVEYHERSSIVYEMPKE